MKYDMDEDFDLQARLRRIGAGPYGAAPAHVRDYVREVARGEKRAGGVANGVASGVASGVVASRLVAWPRSARAAVAGLAAALALAVALGAYPAFVRTGPASATSTNADAARSARPAAVAATPRYSDMWSALSWTDITTTAFPAASPVGDSAISMQNLPWAVDWHGRTYLAIGGAVWSSSDGVHWAGLAGAPTGAVAILPLGDRLVVLGTRAVPCVRTSGVDASIRTQTTCVRPNSLFYSVDGSKFTEAALPWTGGSIQSFATHGHSAVVTLYANDRDLHSQGTYVSSDGAAWVKAILPQDMGSSGNLTIFSTRRGFIASGFVESALGGTSFWQTDSTGRHDLRGDSKIWTSTDGSAWQAADLTPGVGEIWNLHQGALGDAIPDMGLHSVDGTTWDVDDLYVPSGYEGMIRTTSNGKAIVYELATGPSFYVTLGDGRWQKLANEGSIASLPSDGTAIAVPQGLLYVVADRVYFGRAETGVVPAHTLPPAPLPTAHFGY